MSSEFLLFLNAMMILEVEIYYFASILFSDILFKNQGDNFIILKALKAPRFWHTILR